MRDDVREKLRASIRRLLVRHGYPPDQQPGAITLVLEQMEHLAPRGPTRPDGRPREYSCPSGGRRHDLDGQRTGNSVTVPVEDSERSVIFHEPIIAAGS